MTFAEATPWLNGGYKIRRASWPIEYNVHISDLYSDGERYLLIQNRYNELSLTDLKATDWVVGIGY